VRCPAVDYERFRDETSYDLSLQVLGRANLQASFERMVELERLEGENQYDTGSMGNRRQFS
jgi:ubiquitin carboxyl-terminal hydrolase 7